MTDNIQLAKEILKTEFYEKDNFTYTISMHIGKFFESLNEADDSNNSLIVSAYLYLIFSLSDNVPKEYIYNTFGKVVYDNLRSLQTNWKLMNDIGKCRYFCQKYQKYNDDCLLISLVSRLFLLTYYQNKIELNDTTLNPEEVSSCIKETICCIHFSEDNLKQRHKIVIAEIFKIIDRMKF
jgi:hypothetical protein